MSSLTFPEKKFSLTVQFCPPRSAAVLPKLVKANPLRPLPWKLLRVIDVFWMPPCTPSKLLLLNVLLLIVPAFGVNWEPKARDPRFIPTLFMLNRLPLINGVRAALGPTLCTPSTNNPSVKPAPNTQLSVNWNPLNESVSRWKIPLTAKALLLPSKLFRDTVMSVPESLRKTALRVNDTKRLLSSCRLFRGPPTEVITPRVLVPPENVNPSMMEPAMPMPSCRVLVAGTAGITTASLAMRPQAATPTCGPRTFKLFAMTMFSVYVPMATITVPGLATALTPPWIVANASMPMDVAGPPTPSGSVKRGTIDQLSSTYTISGGGPPAHAGALIETPAKPIKIGALLRKLRAMERNEEHTVAKRMASMRDPEGKELGATAATTAFRRERPAGRAPILRPPREATRCVLGIRRALADPRWTKLRR